VSTVVLWYQSVSVSLGGSTAGDRQWSGEIDSLSMEDIRRENASSDGPAHPSSSD
jgi:hypothetical protein